MTEYTITRFDPDSGTIEVQFAGWAGPLAIPVTLDDMGMLPTGAAMDALVGAYAPRPDEVARIASVASAANQDAVNALVGEVRTAELPVVEPPAPQVVTNMGIIQPGEMIPQVSVVI